MRFASPDYCLVWVLERPRGNKAPRPTSTNNRMLWAKDVQESLVSVIFYPRTKEEDELVETPSLMKLYGFRYWISRNKNGRIPRALAHAEKMLLGEQQEKS